MLNAIDRSATERPGYHGRQLNGGAKTMRRLTMATVLGAVVALLGSPVMADDRPGDTTLVDQVFTMAPGANLRECIDVPEMVLLTVFVSASISRTGEAASMNFSDNRQTVSPTVQILLSDIPDEQIISTHLAPAGSYCYYLAVTQNLTSPLPPDALERPYKQVLLKIISTPYSG
jgi:hypothetical protein